MFAKRKSHVHASLIHSLKKLNIEFAKENKQEKAARTSFSYLLTTEY